MSVPVRAAFRIVAIALACLLLAGIAVVVTAWMTLPPPPAAVQRGGARAAEDRAAADGAPLAVARGAYHIHTQRSDGTGTVDDVALAARAAGLDFVVITDHGDATRAPLPPAYRHGVLCIDAVEISTTGGHYVALGLPAAPYRLAGEPRDVVEDVARLGGFGIAAHPDSPKPDLRWSGWHLPVNGLEWLNVDTEWRDESFWRMPVALLQYRWRPAETVASIVGPGDGIFERWDALGRVRRVVGLAAVDAHARLALEGASRQSPVVTWEVPSYESLFRTLTINVELDEPLSKDAAGGAAVLLRALREGRVYSVLDALAAPGHVVFGLRGSTTVRMGQHVPTEMVSAEAEWVGQADAPAGARLRLVCDGKVQSERLSQEGLRLRTAVSGGPAACRLEAGWPRGDGFVRWIVTNPIYLRPADVAPPPAPVQDPIEIETLGNPGTGAAWIVEHDPGSTASVSSTGARREQVVTFEYRLEPGPRASQYAAFVTPDVESLARFERLRFTLKAAAPMRVSVQVRAPGDRGARRWRRSVFVDTEPREITVAFSDMTSVDATAATPSDLRAVKGLLFVVDTEHTVPGSSGVFRLSDLRLER